jgi:adenosylcobinamide kinase/adenosylcobinamide-phosphate guanylyltransferase
MSAKLTLILGGARSGKSAHAQKLAAAEGDHVLYVATALALDAEMAARIAAHRAARPAGWRTLEAPRQVGRAIREAGEGFDAVIVDCLTLLASNVLSGLPEPLEAAAAEAALGEEVEGLVETYRQSTARWIMVSNEIGLGIVPANALARIYRDALGRAHQRLAALAETVLLMVAGIPVAIKAS